MKQELKEILECIAKFDDTESLKAKGRYFEIIQKDVRKFNLTKKKKLCKCNIPKSDRSQDEIKSNLCFDCARVLS